MSRRLYLLEYFSQSTISIPIRFPQKNLCPASWPRMCGFGLLCRHRHGHGKRVVTPAKKPLFICLDIERPVAVGPEPHFFSLFFTFSLFSPSSTRQLPFIQLSVPCCPLCWAGSRKMRRWEDGRQTMSRFSQSSVSIFLLLRFPKPDAQTLNAFFFSLVRRLLTPCQAMHDI